MRGVPPGSPADPEGPRRRDAPARPVCSSRLPVPFACPVCLDTPLCGAIITASAQPTHKKDAENTAHLHGSSALGRRFRDAFSICLHEGGRTAIAIPRSLPTSFSVSSASRARQVLRELPQRTASYGGASAGHSRCRSSGSKPGGLGKGVAQASSAGNAAARPAASR
jgi:hypothetical protein